MFEVTAHGDMPVSGFPSHHRHVVASEQEARDYVDMFLRNLTVPLSVEVREVSE